MPIERAVYLGGDKRLTIERPMGANNISPIAIKK